MGSMYLSQIVTWHSGKGCCGGAPERDVVHDMAKASRTSTYFAQIEVDQAVRDGRLRRVRC